jgi:transcriptional regulator with XRE-family HTH domain
MKFEAVFFIMDSANPAKDRGLSRALERIDQRLSRDLRALRQAKSLTLAQISERIGRSVGWMSQVERGISMPTLVDLRRLADLFGVPMTLFYTREQPADTDGEVVVRAGARRQLGRTEQGLDEELLSPSLGGAFEMRRRVFAPGAESSARAHPDTEEAGFVLSGRLVIEIDGVAQELDQGDSFRFKGKTVRWRNAGDTEAVVIWVMSPPVY